LKPRSRLPLLLAIATVLAAGALAGGGSGAPAAAGQQSPLAPDAPLAVAAGEPALALSGFYSALALLQPAVGEDAMEIASEAEQRAAVELGSFLDGVEGAAIALVAACPPPGNLSCNPGLRALLELDPDANGRRLTRELAALLPAGLRAAGFSDLTVDVDAGAEGSRIRVTSAEETLGLARITADSARVALGGVPLPEPSRPALDPAAEGLAVSLRPAGLGQLLEDETGALAALSELTTRIELAFFQGASGAEVTVRAAGR